MRHLHRHPPRHHDDLRGRGVARHRGGREDRRVPRPLPRAAGRHQPDRGRRARPAAGPRAAGPPRRRGRHRDHPVHQPQPRGRGHGHVPEPAASSRSASRSPASPAACRSAATSSTPTSSPSGGRRGSREVDAADGATDRAWSGRPTRPSERLDAGWRRPGRRRRTGRRRRARRRGGRSSCRMCSVMRVPDMPTGWPRAMAPPLTLTISSVMPRSAIEATPTAAKASLSSNRSMSPTDYAGPLERPAGWPGPAG